jgi:hypothetical protein
MKNLNIKDAVLTWISGRRLLIEGSLTFVTIATASFYAIGGRDSEQTLMISMLALAGFYFIGTNLPVNSENVITLISSKALGISSAITIVGILFIVLGFEGGQLQLRIGLLALLPATLGVMYGVIKYRNDDLLILMIRGMIVFGVGLYLYSQLPDK